jgi:hypothetical protein
MEKTELEQRMSDLEKQVAKLRKRIDELSSTGPWWERIAGSFENDAVYQEAMRLGNKYRRDQKPNGRRRSK